MSEPRWPFGKGKKGDNTKGGDKSSKHRGDSLEEEDAFNEDPKAMLERALGKPQEQRFTKASTDRLVSVRGGRFSWMVEVEDKDGKKRYSIDPKRRLEVGGATGVKEQITGTWLENFRIAFAKKTGVPVEKLTFSQESADRMTKILDQHQQMMEKMDAQKGTATLAEEVARAAGKLETDIAQVIQEDPELKDKYDWKAVFTEARRTFRDAISSLLSRLGAAATRVKESAKETFDSAKQRASTFAQKASEKASSAAETAKSYMSTKKGQPASASAEEGSDPKDKDSKKMVVGEPSGAKYDGGRGNILPEMGKNNEQRFADYQKEGAAKAASAQKSAKNTERPAFLADIGAKKSLKKTVTNDRSAVKLPNKMEKPVQATTPKAAAPAIPSKRPAAQPKTAQPAPTSPKAGVAANPPVVFGGHQLDKSPVKTLEQRVGVESIDERMARIKAKKGTESKQPSWVKKNPDERSTTQKKPNKPE